VDLSSLFLKTFHFYIAANIAFHPESRLQVLYLDWNLPADDP
jgi:hypothetical protein